MAVELVPKRVQVLKEAVRNLSRLALLVDPQHTTNRAALYGVARTAAGPLGVTVQPVGMRTPGDIERAFSTIAESRLQGLCLTSDGLVYVERRRLARLAHERNMPLIGYTREMAHWTGMLITFAASIAHSSSGRRISWTR